MTNESCLGPIQTSCYDCEHCPADRFSKDNKQNETASTGFLCPRLGYGVRPEDKRACHEFKPRHSQSWSPPMPCNDMSWAAGGGIIRAIRELCKARCEHKWMGRECNSCGRMAAYKFFDSYFPGEVLKKEWRMY